MKSLLNKPIRFSYLIKTFSATLSLLTMLRVLLFLVFYQIFSELSWNLIMTSFWLGFRFDLRLTVLVWLPFLMLSWLPGLSFEKWKHSASRIWKIYWMVIAFVLLGFSIADFGYFEYLNTRLDASVLGLVSNFRISLGIFWESYPIIPIFLLLIVVMWAINHFLSTRIFTSPEKQIPAWSLKKRSALYTLTFFTALGMGYGKWSGYPFRWSDAFYSTNHTANQLAINPVLMFLNTLSRSNETYDLEKVNKYSNTIAAYSEIKDSPTQEVYLSGLDTAVIGDEVKPNIIVILLESFPWYKTGYGGELKDATPYFDDIARKSLVFRNFYVTKFSTAGSIFSALTGLPDMATVNKSSTRDPKAINQHLFIDDLEGYDKHFFKGGSANWGDIGGFLRNNVEGIEIHDESSYSTPATNSLGLSDHDLFEEARKVYTRSQKPFLSIVLTAGHHRPHTIPDTTTGFQRKQLSPEHKALAFSSEDELNSFSYMDFALGQFIKNSRNEDYYKNTIFVILGDHGFNHPSQKSPYLDLPLHKYHVPLLFFGGPFKARDDYRIVSEIDLFPTLFGYLNIPYKNSSLGRDRSENYFDSTSYAFMFTEGSMTSGLLGDKRYVLVDANDSVTAYDRETNTILSDLDSLSSSMVVINRALSETAKYLRYNNREDRSF